MTKLWSDWVRSKCRKGPSLIYRKQKLYAWCKTTIKPNRNLPCWHMNTQTDPVTRKHYSLQSQMATGLRTRQEPPVSSANTIKLARISSKTRQFDDVPWRPFTIRSLSVPREEMRNWTMWTLRVRKNFVIAHFCLLGAGSRSFQRTIMTAHCILGVELQEIHHMLISNLSVFADYVGNTICPQASGSKGNIRTLLNTLEALFAQRLRHSQIILIHT